MRALPGLALALATLTTAADCSAEVYARIDPVSRMTVLSNLPMAPAASASGTSPTAAAAPAHSRLAAFPRVSAERQQHMDGLRREILETELGAEQQALAAAASRRAAADIVQRHLANVEALKRELAGVR
jgi:hypothetical protein